MAGNTHGQRRRAQQIKSDWTERVVGGANTLEDLVEAAQGRSDEAKYLGSILLVDLLARVHPGLTRGQIVSELESLPIKAPADPSRFSIRSIRSRPEVVAQVSAMTASSEMTKSAKGRTEVPTNWPWSTKLSDLVRINNGEMPQGLEWLETGEGVDPSDLLLSGEGVDPTFRSAAEDERDIAPMEAGAPEAEPVEADAVDEPEQPADDDDPFAAIERELLADGDDSAEADAAESQDDDPFAASFGDIIGTEGPK